MLSFAWPAAAASLLPGFPAGCFLHGARALAACTRRIHIGAAACIDTPPATTPPLGFTILQLEQSTALVQSRAYDSTARPALIARTTYGDWHVPKSGTGVLSRAASHVTALNSIRGVLGGTAAVVHGCGVHACVADTACGSTAQPGHFPSSSTGALLSRWHAQGGGGAAGWAKGGAWVSEHSATAGAWGSAHSAIAGAWGSAHSARLGPSAWGSLRHMATARGTAQDARVSPSLLRALPFTVPREVAEQQFWAYLQSNPFLASPTRYTQLKETFVPFWLVQLTVESRATLAQVGQRVAVRRLNPSTRRMELTWETQWTSVRAPYALQSVYPPESADMQVCGTTKYIEDDMSALRPGELVARPGLLRPITDPGMLGPNRRVVPFSVRPVDARARALAWIRAQERVVAEEYYRRAFNAEECRVLDLEVTVLQQAAHPVYVPVYVFYRPLPGLPTLLSGILPGTDKEKLHTFVSGVSVGVVAGSQVYDPVKVGAAAGIIAPSILIATGAAVLFTPLKFLVIGVAIPVFAAAALASHAPRVRQAADWAQGVARRVLPDAARTIIKSVLGERLSGFLGIGRPEVEDTQQQTAGKEEKMEDPFVRPYEQQQASSYRAASSGTGYYQQRTQSSQWTGSSSSSWSGRAGQQSQGQGQRQRQAEPSPPGATPGDPKGYYALLGVKPGATQAEVQEAFRTRALQEHPDRFTDPAEKQAATKSFQRLSEAYGVLRNANKRAAYDAGMG